MDIWDAFSYGAWALSALVLLWMVADAVRVARDYDESLLLSSREGSDELIDRDSGASR